MKMEQTECSEMSAYKIQMPGNHPKESIQQNDYMFRPFLFYKAIISSRVSKEKLYKVYEFQHKN